MFCLPFYSNQGRINSVTVGGDIKNVSRWPIFRNKVADGLKKVDSRPNHSEAYEGQGRNLSKHKKRIRVLVENKSC